VPKSFADREEPKQVELNEEERQALLDVLNHALPVLRGELFMTENHGSREELKRRERLLRTLIARLVAAGEPVNSA
jgi:hypothetical protein